MVTAERISDFLITDTPGELSGDRWEDVIETDCPVCGGRCTPVAPAGACWPCTERYRAIDAGCGAAPVLLVVGDPAAALAHLTVCSDCRALFLDLGETARVADMENAHAVSLAAIA